MFKIRLLTFCTVPHAAQFAPTICANLRWQPLQLLMVGSDAISLIVWLPVEGRYENEGRCNRVLGALSKLSLAAGTLEITVLAGMGVVYWGFRSRDPAENRRPAGHPGIATDAAKAFAVGAGTALRKPREAGSLDRTNGERTPCIKDRGTRA
jgi:hypothetical protein